MKMRNLFLALVVSLPGFAAFGAISPANDMFTMEEALKKKEILDEIAKRAAAQLKEDQQKLGGRVYSVGGVFKDIGNFVADWFIKPVFNTTTELCTNHPKKFAAIALAAATYTAYRGYQWYYRGVRTEQIKSTLESLAAMVKDNEIPQEANGGEIKFEINKFWSAVSRAYWPGLYEARKYGFSYFQDVLMTNAHAFSKNLKDKQTDACLNAACAVYELLWQELGKLDVVKAASMPAKIERVRVRREGEREPGARR